MSKIWTAKESTEDGKIVFDVLDEQTDNVYEQELASQGLALKMALGGYSPAIAAMLILQSMPWHFREMSDGQIYLDGPSIGVDDYHPID